MAPTDAGRDYVLKRYEAAIAYYWSASRNNDRIIVTPDSNPASDLALLNGLVLSESTGFFNRIMGTAQRGAAPSSELPGGGG